MLQALKESTAIITPTTAVIRTSDRGAFKSCRRRWALSSGLQRNLEPIQKAGPLWFGSGIHYALEDMYSGPGRKYKTPEEAFTAYCKATLRQGRETLPDDWKDLFQLGLSMLRYYRVDWLKARKPLKTFRVKKEPQVEINFLVELPFNPQDLYPDSPFDKVVYSGTIDRIIVDDVTGLLWLVDYKTAKALKVSHFANDPQVSAYCWAAYHIYQRPIGGMIYWQFLKDSPTPPEPLVSGKISTAKNQRTSHTMYRRALVETYGSVKKSPAENVDFLNRLVLGESEDQDPYIRRDRIYKNKASLESEGTKIMLELEDMLNPHLPLYPNPNFLCPGMCPFYEVCVSMDDGSEWEDQLEDETQLRSEYDSSWRNFLEPTPIEDNGKKDFE